MKNKISVADFREAKINGRKISMLTAYDYPSAKIIDESGTDAILVGDSLGMVVLGYEDTIKVTMEDMIHHIKAVVRGTKRAMVVGDMPFLSYHTGKYESVKNAGRLLSEGGCSAIKLEGGANVIESVKAIISAGIPVMGHLGFTPQSINLIGRPLSQGKTIEKAREILQDALLLQEAGVFSIVLECVPYKLARYISSKLDIPTIGIGSGAGCDGQVLVTPEVIGLYDDVKLKHVKQYLNVSSLFREAVKKYIEEVEDMSFPTQKNSFIIKDDVIEELQHLYDKGEL